MLIPDPIFPSRVLYWIDVCVWYQHVTYKLDVSLFLLDPLPQDILLIIVRCNS